MPKTYICPFYQWDKKDFVCCEDFRLVFASREKKREYTRDYCANMDGWRNCSYAKAMMRTYGEGGQNGKT